MTMPNFLIIGAAKSGTTALYHYLQQHPQIYMSPKKETNFFSLEGEKRNFYELNAFRMKNSVNNITAYCNLFQGVSNETAIGEASPWYLYDVGVPERIQSYLPEVKLIAILRNPAERAYSHFLNSARDGKESLTDFAQALREEEHTRSNWHPLVYHYQQMGFYYAQLKRYYDTFDQDQIRVYLYEDFKASSISVLRDIFQFLGVNDTFAPNMSLEYNKSGIPKNKALHIFLKKRNPIKFILKPFLPEELRKRIARDLQERNLDKPPPLAPEMRQQLIEVYREDTLKLQDLIQRDLSKWLK